MIGFVADCHLANHRAFAAGPLRSGLNSRFLASLASLDAAVKKARKRGCSEFVIAGDLFDGVAPIPQMVRACRDVLWGSEMEVLVLVGNHDRVSTSDGDHALGPLAGKIGGIVDVYERPTASGQIWLVPSEPGNGEENVRRALSDLGAQCAAAGGVASARRRVLALHYGISDSSTPPYLARAEDAIRADFLFDLMAEHGISAAFAGNWHRAQAWERDGLAIVQIGALAPRDFRDEGLEGYGGIAFYDPETDEIVLDEVPGDRFVIARTPEDAAGAKAPAGGRVFVRRTYEKVEGEETTADGAEDLPDLSLAEEATRAAASAARGKDTLDEALAAFVSEMPLPEGVERESVLSRCRAFLKGAEG